MGALEQGARFTATGALDSGGMSIAIKGEAPSLPYARTDGQACQGGPPAVTAVYQWDSDAMRAQEVPSAAIGKSSKSTSTLEERGGSKGAADGVANGHAASPTLPQQAVAAAQGKSDGSSGGAAQPVSGGKSSKNSSRWVLEAGAGTSRSDHRYRRTEFRCQVCSTDLADQKVYFKRYSICPAHATGMQIVQGKQVLWCQQCGKFEDPAMFDLAIGSRSCRESLAKRRARLKRRSEAQAAACSNGTQRARSSEQHGGGASAGADGSVPLDQGMSRARSPGVVQAQPENSSQSQPQVTAGSNTSLEGAGTGLPVPTLVALMPQAPYATAEAQAPMQQQPGTMPALYQLQHLQQLQHLEGQLICELGSQGTGIEDFEQMLHMLDEEERPAVPAPAPPPLAHLAPTQLPMMQPPASAAQHGVASVPVSASGVLLKPLGPMGNPAPRPVQPSVLQPMASSGVYSALLPLPALGPASGPMLGPMTSVPTGMLSSGGGVPMHLSTEAAVRSMLDGSGMVPVALPPEPERLVRLSLKLLGCTPSDLPANLRAELERALAVSPTIMQGFVRPGCVHLTVDVWLDAASADGLSAPALLSTLRAGALGSLALSSLQLDKKIAVVGRASTEPLVVVAPAAPELHRVSPLALALPQPAVPGSSASPGEAAAIVWLLGPGLAGEGVSLHCRAAGSFQPVQLLAAEGESVASCSPRTVAGSSAHEEEESEDEAGGDQALALLPLDGLAPGLAQWELQWGSAILCTPLPQLLLPCEEAAAEVNTLDCEAVDMVHVAPLLHAIGLTVAFLHGGAGEALAVQRSMVARAARRAVVVCVMHGWNAVTRLLLPGVTADGATAAAALADMDAQMRHATGTLGMTLLHAAVGSGKTEMLATLCAWGQSTGEASLWRTDAPGTAGATPLHMAALLGKQPSGQALDQLMPLLGEPAPAAKPYFTRAAGVVADATASTAACATATAEMAAEAAASCSTCITRHGEPEANQRVSQPRVTWHAEGTLISLLCGMVGKALFRETPLSLLAIAQMPLLSMLSAHGRRWHVRHLLACNAWSLLLTLASLVGALLSGGGTGIFGGSSASAGPVLLSQVLADVPLRLALVFLALMPAMAYLCLASAPAALKVPATAVEVADCGCSKS